MPRMRGHHRCAADHQHLIESPGMGVPGVPENWAVTTVNPAPQPFFDCLAATVEQFGAARSMLRQVITLADDTPGLTDEQLRNRLTALADQARPGAHPRTGLSDPSSPPLATAFSVDGVNLK